MTQRIQVRLSTREIIRRAFEPLRAGYALAESHSDEDGTTACVHFQNTTTGVYVRVDWGEFRPFVELIDVSVAEETPSRLQSFDADWLFELRAGPTAPAGLLFTERSEAAAHRLLSRYSEALDRYAADVLHGDFSITARVAKVIAERRRAPDAP